MDILDANRRAWAGGAAILMVLLAAWLGWRRADADPVVREECAVAVVKSVAAGGGMAICEVEVEGRARARVACGLPAPKEGDTLPLRALVHLSGKTTWSALRGAGACP